MGLSQSFTIVVILLCQFIAALSALGMPPFFALFLKKSYGSEVMLWGIPLAGMLFVVPTFFSGITSPFWGRMADRYGKKRLLLRAQLGLALSFLVAGFAKTPFQFFLALLIQGLLGGTFAASKAYLATLLKGEVLAHGLTWMEASARAALVAGPFLVGFFMKSSSPVEIYRYLALLPLFSMALTALISNDSIQLSSKSNISESKVSKSEISKSEISRKHSVVEPIVEVPSIAVRTFITPQLVMALQFVFGMSAVMISPYFNLAMNQRFPFLSHGQLGLIFGLPHLAYLACAGPLTHLINPNRLLEFLLSAFVIQALSILGQAQSLSLLTLMTYRLLSGISMTVIFICIHLMIAKFTVAKTSGGLFGRLEGSVRLSNVLGGLIASVALGNFGLLSIFYLSSATLGITSLYLFYLVVSRQKEILA